MTIDQTIVAKISSLARLKIPEDEQAQVAAGLDRLLAWVAQLDEVNTDGVEPLASVHDADLRTRTDAVTDGGWPDAVLANAPARTGDFFTVPKVIE